MATVTNKIFSVEETGKVIEKYKK